MKKMIILGVGFVVVNALTVGGAVILSGALNSEPEPDMAAAAPEPVDRELFYHYVQPEFVINFRDRERPRALMVEIAISSYDEKALDELDTHSPELRNNLMLLMSESSGMVLSTLAGKEEMRESVKTVLNELSLKHAGIEAVEDIFFTRFVLQ